MLTGWRAISRQRQERASRELSRRPCENALERVRARRSARRLADELDEIAARCSALPGIDDRSEDEILGYDQTEYHADGPGLLRPGILLD